MDGSNQGEAPKVDVSKSNLSVNAPVFVPRGFGPPPAVRPPYHGRNNQPSYHHHYDAEEEYVESEPQYRFHGTALDRIKQAESTLIANPGSFDDIMKPITDALTTAISNEKTLVTVTEEIFKQCISEANFRYTGARLCNHLSQNLSLTFPGGDFRQQLLKRCYDEHQKREELATEPSKHEHLQGFMLFMAELLLNMTDSEGNRIPILSQAVKEIVVSLLNHPTDSSLKSVVQVLKLSGQYLEPETDGAQGEGLRPLDEVFAKIDSVLQEETLNRSVRNMLGSVVTLRSKDWGRKDSGLNGSGLNNPYAANNPYAQHNPYADQPFPDQGGYPGDQGGYPGMEGGGGHMYPPYQDHGHGDPGNGFPQMPIQQVGEELDDEMASAFEEFLLETGQIDGQ